MELAVQADGEATMSTADSRPKGIVVAKASTTAPETVVAGASTVSGDLGREGGRLRQHIGLKRS